MDANQYQYAYDYGFQDGWKAALDRPVEQEPVGIALHYPECWDTAAYPTFWDALDEVVARLQCSNDDCKHKTAPVEQEVGK